LHDAKRNGICHYMFVRYRQTESRLQVSLIETRRVDGKVRHIASFGSVEVPPSVEDRIAFWQRLHERLAKLSNRLDAAAQEKILGDVHARIPMVTLDEQRALQLRNAESDEWFWSRIHDMHAGTVEEHKGLATTVERNVAEGEVEIAKVAVHRDAARERIERLRRGEDVPGGLGKPLDVEKTLRQMGFKTADLSHMRTMAALPEDAIPILAQEGMIASERATRRLARRLRRLLDRDDDGETHAAHHVVAVDANDSPVSPR
jgi:hypothetical protein